MFSFLFWVVFLAVWTKTAGLVCGGVKRVLAKDERVQEEGKQIEKSMRDAENRCVCLMAGLIIIV